MLAVTLIALACLLITIGRYQVRKARRSNQRRLLLRLVGWAMTLLGFFTMMWGVIEWGMPSLR